LYDAELHLVHQDDITGEYAVIGIFFDRKAGGNNHNSFIESLQIKNLKKTDSFIIPSIPLVNKLIEKLNTDKIYNYAGSLTVPPCEESVNWIVIDDPQPISDSQIADLQAYWANN
jgi:carbonic anhydrase